MESKPQLQVSTQLLEEIIESNGQLQTALEECQSQVTKLQEEKEKTEIQLIICQDRVRLFDLVIEELKQKKKQIEKLELEKEVLEEELRSYREKLQDEKDKIETVKYAAAKKAKFEEWFDTIWEK